MLDDEAGRFAYWSLSRTTTCSVSIVRSRRLAAWLRSAVGDPVTAHVASGGASGANECSEATNRVSVQSVGVDVAHMRPFRRSCQDSRNLCQIEGGGNPNHPLGRMAQRAAASNSPTCWPESQDQL